MKRAWAEMKISARTNPFVAARGDKMAMRTFGRILWPRLSLCRSYGREYSGTCFDGGQRLVWAPHHSRLCVCEVCGNHSRLCVCEVCSIWSSSPCVCSVTDAQMIPPQFTQRLAPVTVVKGDNTKLCAALTGNLWSRFGVVRYVNVVATHC